MTRWKILDLFLLLLVVCSSPAVAGTCWEAECGPNQTEEDCTDTAEDPFCSDGGSGDYPQKCHYCEETPTGGKCSQVAEGQTGQTDCTNTYIGTDPVSCTTSGNFCENITITP